MPTHAGPSQCPEFIYDCDVQGSLRVSQQSYSVVRSWGDHYFFTRTCSFLISTKVLYLPQPARIIQRKNLKKERDKNFLSFLSNLSLALLLLKKAVSIPLTSWLQGTPLHQGGLAEVHLMSQALLEERTKAQMGNCTSITWPFTPAICKNQLSFLPFLISEQQVMSDFMYNYVSCLLTFVDQLHFQTSASNIFFWPESGSDTLYLTQPVHNHSFSNTPHPFDPLLGFFCCLVVFFLLFVKNATNQTEWTQVSAIHKP